MKKFFSISIVFLLFISFTSAQSVHLGIKGGLNLHKIKGAPFEEKFNFGYQAGLFAEINIIPGVGIQPEVLFSNVTADTAKGFTGAGFSPEKKVSFTYIEVPVLFNYKAIPFISFQIGPQFDIKLSDGKTALTSGKEAFKKSNIGVAGGLQINLKKFKVYGRYVLGLSNLNNSGSGGKWQDQSIKAGIGYRIF